MTTLRHYPLTHHLVANYAGDYGHMTPEQWKNEADKPNGIQKLSNRPISKGMQKHYAKAEAHLRKHAKTIEGVNQMAAHHAKTGDEHHPHVERVLNHAFDGDPDHENDHVAELNIARALDSFLLSETPTTKKRIVTSNAPPPAGTYAYDKMFGKYRRYSKHEKKIQCKKCNFTFHAIERICPNCTTVNEEVVSFPVTHLLSEAHALDGYHAFCYDTGKHLSGPLKNPDGSLARSNTQALKAAERAHPDHSAEVKKLKFKMSKDGKSLEGTLKEESHLMELVSSLSETSTPEYLKHYTAWRKAAEKPGPKGGEHISSFNRRQERIAKLKQKYETSRDEYMKQFRKEEVSSLSEAQSWKDKDGHGDWSSGVYHGVEKVHKDKAKDFEKRMGDEGIEYSHKTKKWFGKDKDMVHYHFHDAGDHDDARDYCREEVSSVSDGSPK